MPGNNPSAEQKVEWYIELYANGAIKILSYVERPFDSRVSRTIAGPFATQEDAIRARMEVGE